jgi:hypothetical protein
LQTPWGYAEACRFGRGVRGGGERERESKESKKKIFVTDLLYQYFNKNSQEK